MKKFIDLYSKTPADSQPNKSVLDYCVVCPRVVPIENIIAQFKYFLRHDKDSQNYELLKNILLEVTSLETLNELEALK